MDRKRILFLLTLVSTILARPQDSCDYEYDDGCEEAADPCENYFQDATKINFAKLGVNSTTRAEHLTYTCVEKTLCKDNRDPATGQIVPYSGGPSLETIINAAQNANCKETGQVCCNVQYAKEIPVGPKCSETVGYRCVSNINCKGDVNTDENMKATCFVETRSIQKKICCKEEEIVVPPPACSDESLKENGKQIYSCVSADKCKGNSIDKRSSLGSLLTPANLAESATCSSESEVCCHEADIKLPCTDYAADGYECSDTCFDLEQDFPKPEDRKSNIKHYNPKNTFCPRELQGHVCCKRPEPIKPTKPPKDCESDKSKCQKCEDWGSEYKCSRMEHCDPDTFAAKEPSEENIREQTVNDLFDPSNLFTQNAADGIAVNTDLVPCESALALCCIPKPPHPCDCDPATTCSGQGSCQEDCGCQCNTGFTGKDCSIKNECKVEPVKPGVPTQCGVHNPNGVKGPGRVTARQIGASSQEGEWPHACLLFHKDKTIGGASLIAPKVLVTAAHLLETKEGEKFTKLKAEDLKVRCGDYDLTSGDHERYKHQDRDLDTYTIHPFYSGQRKKTAIKLANDIAILHTKEDFMIAQNVNPICLPSFDSPTINGLCSSMGWGVNSEKAEELGQDIMKQVRLNQITDRDDCKKRILDSGAVAKVWQLDDSWICAKAHKNESKDNILCKGDGGGPLVCQETGGEPGKERHVLAGIIAYGIGCGSEVIPDVFASVHDALCFIDYDVKCKHGNKFITHFDYKKDCGRWYEDEVSSREGVPISTVRRQLSRLKKLVKTCSHGRSTDLSVIGGRTEEIDFCFKKE